MTTSVDIETEAIYLAHDAVRELMRAEGLALEEAVARAEETLPAWNLDGIVACRADLVDAIRQELRNLSVWW